MNNTSTLNLQIDTNVKERAEAVFSKLGIPMSTAIDMFLKQVTVTGEMPFSVAALKAPKSVNADLMTAKELNAKLEKGLQDAYCGNTKNASCAFEQFRKN